MLMTAGLGTRLRPFTEIAPKHLLPVMGVPMAQFAVDLLARFGVSRIVCNVHHRADLAVPALKALEHGPGTSIEISDESQLLLGSAGGIRKALPLLGRDP